MRIKRINGMFAVASQVDIKTVKDVAQAGYKTLICNRPDCEADDYDLFPAIAAEAKRLRITPVYLPISLLGASVHDQKKFDDLILNCPKPIVAYCRSGARPAVLWSRFDVVQNGGRTDGVERRVGAISGGALGVSHGAGMAFAAGFNTASKRVSNIVSDRRSGGSAA
jgi:uncharacterized protein (TIGR01244 family)